MLIEEQLDSASKIQLNHLKQQSSNENDFIELDIQQTADNRIVVYHDSHFTDDGINISDLPYQDVKQRTEQLGLEIPELCDVLALVNGRVGINIEVKRLNDVDLLIEQFKNFSTDKIFFSSFNHSVIATLKEKYPNITTGTLMVSKVLDPLFLIESLKSDILCQHYGFIDKEFVKQVQSAGKKIYAWVVNYEADIKHFNEMGVDGIFTDYPQRAREILKSSIL